MPDDGPECVAGRKTRPLELPNINFDDRLTSKLDGFASPSWLSSSTSIIIIIPMFLPLLLLSSSSSSPFCLYSPFSKFLSTRFTQVLFACFEQHIFFWVQGRTSYIHHLQNMLYMLTNIFTWPWCFDQKWTWKIRTHSFNLKGSAFWWN